MRGQLAEIRRQSNRSLAGAHVARHDPNVVQTRSRAARAPAEIRDRPRQVTRPPQWDEKFRSRDNDLGYRQIRWRMPRCRSNS
jgi:hypothetical protein